MKTLGKVLRRMGVGGRKAEAGMQTYSQYDLFTSERDLFVFFSAIMWLGDLCFRWRNAVLFCKLKIAIIPLALVGIKL